MKKKITIGIGSLLCLLAFVFMIILTVPTMNEKRVTFRSTYNEKEVTLKGSYYEAKDAEYAALICPGYSCDREKWRPFADMFVSDGITTMTFDYAGQGASYSTIGFNNAKTDAIPEEIDDALEVLHEKSGIPYDHIILVGHSMGGRSIMRLLYDYNNSSAVTNVTYKDIRNVILLSPEVNYGYNAQASLFAGTSDAEESPWKEYAPSDTGNAKIYLIGSTGDDIVSDDDIWAISSRITSVSKTTGKGEYEDEKLHTVVVGGILHSYMMYSPSIARHVNSFTGEITGVTPSYHSGLISLVYVSWALSLAGIFLILYGLTHKVAWEAEDTVPVLKDEKKFLLHKLLMWLPATVIAFLVCCICVVMPFGSPIMNTPYMCFIAGYGIWMLFCYRKGKFKGTEGKLPKPSFKIHADKKTILMTVSAVVLLCAFVWFVLFATMYRLIPLNFRLFWVIFAGVLMGIGYYVSSAEADMLDAYGASARCRFFYNVIQYVPLFLLVLFYLVLKSYSGMIGQVQNMILMYIFCVPLGEFIKRKTKNRLYGAFVTALLFQTLMITSAALISMF